MGKRLGLVKALPETREKSSPKFVRHDPHEIGMHRTAAFNHIVQGYAGSMTAFPNSKQLWIQTETTVSLFQVQFVKYKSSERNFRKEKNLQIICH